MSDLFSITIKDNPAVRVLLAQLVSDDERERKVAERSICGILTAPVLEQAKYIGVEIKEGRR